jgi:hypothetical protein
MRYSSNPAVQKFFEAHGDHVRRHSQVIFEDGAWLENSVDGFGAMRLPPTDAHELAKIVCVYWEIKAKAATAAFEDYRGALNGTGAGLIMERTANDQLTKLRKLRDVAQRMRREFNAAKQEVEATTPAWLAAKRRDAAQQAKRSQEFKDRVRAIKL